MKPLSCLEMNAGIIRSWLDDRLDADSSVKVKQHLRECSSCFSSLMGTMSHNLFTFLKDGDTAQVSSFREQVSHLLSQEPPLPDTSDKPIPAFSPDEFLILELLAGNQSRYGLELVEKSESRLKHDKIYVTLERMQEIGLVESRHEQEDSSGPGIPGRRYKATTFGKRVYAVWYNSQVEGSTVKGHWNPKLEPISKFKIGNSKGSTTGGS